MLLNLEQGGEVCLLPKFHDKRFLRSLNGTLLSTCELRRQREELQSAYQSH